MAQPIDPKSPPSNPERQPSKPPGKPVAKVYQRAVAAFKGREYNQALALFQRLGQQPPSSPYYLKALMGQVRVYQRLGQGDQARLLCQQLLDSASPQASQWAAQMLDQLPQTPTVEPPLSPQVHSEQAYPDPLSPQVHPEQAYPDPLQPDSLGVGSGADLSGFVPLEPPKSSPQPAVPPPPARPPTPKDLGKPIKAEAKATTTAKGEPPSPASESQSLFHFQQLNQHPGEDPVDSPIPPAQPAASTESRAAGPAPARRPQPQTALPRRPLVVWLGQAGTAIALLWVINWGVHFLLTTVDGGLRWVRWPVRLSLPGANQTYTAWIIGIAVVLALASPWLMDYALAAWYRQKPLSTRQLQAHSPDSLRVLRQVCRQQGWQLPELRLIADPAPLCFSYGWLPRNTRIVISQGVVDQGSDDTLTALYTYELARMVNGSLPVLSAVGLPLLVLYHSYQWLALVGDGLTQPLVRNLLGLLASLVYGLFWLLRQLVLWLSRLCSGWGDRRSVALTQHPDQLAEGLLAFSAAIAAYLQQRGTLHPLHSSLEVLMPVSSRQAITPGSLLVKASEPRPEPRSEPHTELLTALVATEGLNPYRQWLRVNASHVPLGERLIWLNQQTLRQGQPGLDLDHRSLADVGQVSLPLLFRQKGPLAGLMLGGGLAMGLWFLGGIVNRLGWQRLSWLYQDPSILTGGLWLGLGLGLLLRINMLFPDIKTPSSDSDTVAALLHHTSLLPVQGQPVTLRGTLRGQPGIGNWGCQDLYLEDSTGWVRLVNPMPLGSLQGWLQNRNHPLHWVGRRVTVSGWGRHGSGMHWVDIHQMQLDQRHPFITYGPIWATLISLGSSLIGIATIVRGG